MSFSEQVKQNYEAAKKIADSQPVQDYRAILDEFVKAVQELGIGAWLQASQDSRKMLLFVHTVHRPQLASLLLRFDVEGDGVTVSGADQTQLKSPHSLRDWILEFVKRPEFLDTVETLRMEASEPIEARLFQEKAAIYKRGDMLVSVSPDTQKVLYETPLETELTLKVTRDEFPGNPHYTEALRYTALNSAGLLIEIDSIQPSGDTLQIRGRRVK